MMKPPYHAEFLIDCGEYYVWFCWWSLAAIAIWLRTLLQFQICNLQLAIFNPNREPAEHSPVSQLGRFPTGFG